MRRVREEVQAPMPAAMRQDGYGERTLLPGQGPSSGEHGEDCSCAACETHRTFHALLRGSDPKPRRPGRRPPAPVAEWDSSEGAPLAEPQRPALRLMKWKGNAEEAPRARPSIPRPKPRAKEWNSEIAQPLSSEVDPPARENRTTRLDQTRPRVARAASADVRDEPPPGPPAARRGQSAPRKEAVRQSRPSSAESQPQEGCPRCGRAVVGRALVMHLKTCGVPTRSRGDPFGPGDSQSAAKAPSAAAAVSREAPRPLSPPVPAMAAQPAPSAPSRPRSPPVPAVAQGFPGPEPALDAEEAEPLAPCCHCGRNFRRSALERHEGICQKVFQEKRKVFNAVKNAVPVEAIKAKKASERQEKMQKQDKRAPRAGMAGARVEEPLKAVPNWKKQSEAFRNAIKQARVVDHYVKEGKPLSSLPPPPPTDPALDDRTPCPHCGRRFGQAQAERHIPHCAKSKQKRGR